MDDTKIMCPICGEAHTIKYRFNGIPFVACQKGEPDKVYAFAELPKEITTEEIHSLRLKRRRRTKSMMKHIQIFFNALKSYNSKKQN